MGGEEREDKRIEDCGNQKIGRAVMPVFSIFFFGKVFEESNIMGYNNKSYVGLAALV